MFECTQERPVYWDNLPFDRSLTLTRGTGNKDWIASWKRIGCGREHATIDAAIRYAKRLLAQRPGCPVEITHLGSGSSRSIARVQRDALGRVWCDSFSGAGLI